MEVIKKSVTDKVVKLGDLNDGDCFIDKDRDADYSIKTNQYRENNEILTVSLPDGEVYWERENVKVIPIQAKIIVKD